MQSDDYKISTKALSLLSAATIAATLMGTSSVAATVDQMKYEDATTQRLTEKVTKQASFSKTSSSTEGSITTPAAVKAPRKKSIDIYITMPTFKVPDLKMENMPDFSGAGNQVSKFIDDQKINVKVNDAIKSASGYADSITIKNTQIKLPDFDELSKIYKNPAPYKFSSSPASEETTKPIAKAQSLKPRPAVEVPGAVNAVLPKIEIPDFTSDKPINIDFPPLDLFKSGGSKMLTTTLQSESKPAERTKTIANDVGKPTIIDAPVINDNYTAIRELLKSLIDASKIEWEYVLGLVGFVLIVDSMSGQQLFRQDKEEKEKLIKKLESELKVKAMSENPRVQNDTSEVDFRNKEMAAKIASLEQELSDRFTKSVKSDNTISMLNAKIASLQFDLTKAQNDNGNKVAVIQKIEIPTDTSAWEKKISTLQEREEAIVAILKKFLVDQGYLPQGVANMLLASTIVETLEKSSSSPKVLSEEVSILKKSIAKLEKTNLESNKTETDAQKYVAQLTAENDELKQKLLLSDERLFELQEQMQSKLDSAKAVAKVLNEKLAVATKPKEIEEAPKVKKVATKKQKLNEEPTSDTKESTPASMKNKLEFTAGQLQKKTKKDLSELLKSFGIEDIDGVKVDACLKTDIILALERCR